MKLKILYSFLSLLLFTSILYPLSALSYPDEEKGVVSVGSYPIDVAVSTDDRFVVTADAGGGTLSVIDTASFTSGAQEVSVCDEPQGVTFAPLEDEYRFYASCQDGYVDAVYITVSDGLDLSISTEEIEVSEDGYSLTGIAATSDGAYIVVAEPDNLYLHFIDTGSHEVDSDSDFPVSLAYTPNSVEITPEGSRIILANSNGTVSKVDTDTWNLSSITENCSTIELMDITAVDEDTAYVTGSTYIYEIDLYGNDCEGAEDIEFSSPYGIQFYEDAEGEEYLLVTDISEETLTLIDLSEFEIATSIIIGDTPYETAPSSSDDGYIYVANYGDSTISVVSSNPWVEVTEVSPDTLYSEEESLSITFTSDEDGTYSIYSGGGIDGSGDEIEGASGDIEAGGEVTVEISGGDLAEGANHLFVFVEDDGSNRGRDSFTVELDTPPDVPEGFSVDFGNQKLILTWDTLTEEDISYYNIYFSEEYFDQDEEGPSGSITVDDSTLTSPETTSQPDDPDSETTITYTLSPLENGKTYYVAVSGVDEAGNEGERTETLSGTPEETVGAAGLGGEEGGYCGACSTRGNGGGKGSIVPILFLLATLSGIPLAAMRGRGGASTLSFLFLSIIFLMTARGSARAEERLFDEEEGLLSPFDFSQSPLEYSLTMRSGVMNPSAQEVRQIYGEFDSYITEISFSYIFIRQIEAGLSISFLQDSGYAVGILSGEESGDQVWWDLIPIRGFINFHLSFLKEQFLTPFFGLGVAYSFFSEEGEDFTVDGGKWGISGDAGLLLLLDTMDQERATDLDIFSGINNTFLTLNFNYLTVDDFWKGEGLDWGGYSITTGIRFEF